MRERIGRGRGRGVIFTALVLLVAASTPSVMKAAEVVFGAPLGVRGVSGGAMPSDSGAYACTRMVPRGLLTLYQKFLSPARGTVCPMYPHCSRFASNAYTRRNFAVATAMTCDRLLRCGGDSEEYERGLVGASYLWIDSDIPEHPANASSAEGSGMVRGGSSPWSRTRSFVAASVMAAPGAPDDGFAAPLDFGRWLMERGEYDRAITEYMRLLSSASDPETTARAQRSISYCFYLSGRPAEALRWAGRLGDLDVDRRLRNEELYLVGVSSLRLGAYDTAAESFAAIAAQDSCGDDAFHSTARAPLLHGLSLAHQRAWARSVRVFDEVSKDSPFRMQAAHCAGLSRLGQALPRKNPRTAGILAIVPGLGYLYDGYERTALAALVINGLFMLGTAEAYRKDDEGLGTLLGVVGAGWYAGNFYGSVVSAHRANRKHEDDLLRKYELGFEF